MDGVLKSWAVPKGPPVASGIKRLAMAVDDHPLEYGSFQGTIPEGGYGAGKVIIWDHGDYTLKERTARIIQFELHGAKLKGDYELLYWKEERGRAQWLLFMPSKKEKKN
jgi:DNA ligase D-like protein (predicted 3'-phosphoesterase)